MKITQAADISAHLSASTPQDTLPKTHPDLPRTRKPPPPPLRRQSPRPTSRLTSRRQVAKPSSSSAAAAHGTRNTGPPTPLLRWKFEGSEHGGASSSAQRTKLEELEDEGNEVMGAEKARGVGFSARKLGAAFWRFSHSADVGRGGVGGGRRRSGKEDVDRLEFQPGFGQQRGDLLSGPHGSGRCCVSEAMDLLKSPCSVNAPINGCLYEYSNYAMEGATKWDPVAAKALIGSTVDHKQNHASVVSSLREELEKAQGRIQELEAESKSSKKKMEHFLQKLGEERAAWRRKEHEKVRAFINDLRTDLSRVKKSRQRLEIINSKLVNDLSEAKLSAKRYLQEYENERKGREVVEEVCDELAKEIGEDKAEIEALKRECMKMREDVEEERKMLQMAEVWREERVQMKLVDAKVTLDEKYSQMNRLILELENFLRTRGLSLDPKEMKEAEMLRQAAASVEVQGGKEFAYKPPNPDDMLAVLKQMAMGELNEWEAEPCGACSPSSPASEIRNLPDEKNSRPLISYASQSGVLEEDDQSVWETVSQVEDQDYSFSPEGSIPSVGRTWRDGNVSGSCTDREISPCDATCVTEISEVCSMGEKQLKKASSISRLWRPWPKNDDDHKSAMLEGINGRRSNAGLPNSGVMCPENNYRKGESSPSDVVDQWSSPDSAKSRAVRGMKGCMEWPLGVQKNSLKQKLIEARAESQKIQLRQVLKQKI